MLARLKALVLPGLLAVMLASCAYAADPEKEWTILVYMNGKNNLERYALANFYAMRSVGSTAAVNIVAELGRPKVHHASSDGPWSGVLRFYVTNKTRPIPSDAVEDLAKNGEPTDMGSPETFRRFLSWGKQKYPAKRYMVIIWNHGQGWRYQLAPTMQARAFAAQGKFAEAKAAAGRPVPAMGGVRAVSSDDDTGSILFNRDVQDSLSDTFPTSRPLDVLGYDACLMSMLETAYGVAPYVKVMVASEELEPGDGWDYARWLGELVSKPTASGDDLAAMVIRAYAARYGDYDLTTLSALRLAEIRKVSRKLTDFSRILAQDPKERQVLLMARGELTPYGDPDLNTSIDLIALLEFYEKRTSHAQLAKQSMDLRRDLSTVVLTNYASKRSADPSTRLPSGSRGIAIYFPRTAADFQADPWRDGYIKRNTHKPVDFVRDESWADMLYQILGVNP